MAKGKGDIYALGTMRLMSLPLGAGLKEGPVIIKLGHRVEDARGETELPWMKGESENHKGQRVVGLYTKDPFNQAAIDLMLYYLEERPNQIGLEGKELHWTSSHWGHYGAVYGPALFTGMRSGNERVVKAVLNIWRGLYASAMVLSYIRSPRYMKIVSPCARCHLAVQEGSDQRAEINMTMSYLRFGRLDRVPEWLTREAVTTSPSGLGLTSLFMIEDAWQREEEWAEKWPDYLNYIKEGGEDRKHLPKLNRKLVVVKDNKSQSYLAYLCNVDGLRNPAEWVLVREEPGGRVVEEYGYPKGKRLPEYKFRGVGETIVFPVVGQGTKKKGTTGNENEDQN